MMQERWLDCCRATMRWLLGRPVRGGFVDTRMNPLTGADYTDADGLRAPRYTAGWIQGRALEAVTTHAAALPDLAAPLDRLGAGLHGALAALHDRDGGAFFLYDADLRPVVPVPGTPPQSNPDGVFTYADAFAAKGLLSAAARFTPDAMPARTERLLAVVAAVEDGRFQIDEARPLSAAAVAAQPQDYGPAMILLGAAGLLHRLGLSANTAFADRLIERVLSRHLDPRTDLLRNVPGGAEVNPGHAIEFTGFAAEHLGPAGDPALLARLAAILKASFAAGFDGRGVAQIVAADGGAASDRRPWWPLPEAIRAGTLLHRATGDPALAALVAEADRAFFAHYWRGQWAIQTLGPDGPVDFVPATPDLDPGYHTGLSLLTAALTEKG